MTDQLAPGWIKKQAEISLTRLLPRLKAPFADAGPAAWDTFKARLTQNFENLFGLLLHLYGSRYDFFYHLESILETAARMWLARPAELKALDAERETNPQWFQSQEMLGGVCYVDLFAGNLPATCAGAFSSKDDVTAFASALVDVAGVFVSND